MVCTVYDTTKVSTSNGINKEKRKEKIKIPLVSDGKSTEYVTRTYCSAKILHDHKASN